MISEDPQVREKVDEWQRDTESPTLVIPIHANATSAALVRVELLGELRRRLGERDLYRNQNPVTGDDFFGRQDMLRNLSAALQSDENVAILGLRRSGKTSVLRELKRQLLARGTIVTLGDFQVLDKASVGTLAKSIASNLIDDLREARDAGHDVTIGNEKDQRVDDISLPDLSDRIRRVASRNPDLRFVVAIDEVESASRIAKTEPQQIKSLLGALRAAAQARPNVSLAFAGVANRMFRSTVLGHGEDAVDNPMFGQVASAYITAFEIEETRNLLVELGRPMFMDWNDEAIYAVQSATGGMPYFVRNLASAVRQAVRDGEDEPSFDVTTVTGPQVQQTLSAWRDDASHDWAQLIEALRLHYPEAADLLDPGLSSGELDQWIAADSGTRDAADDLMRLGLLQKRGNTSWQRTDTLEAIHALISGRPSSSTTPNRSSPDDILEVIKGGESRTVEFKETFRINTHTNERDQRMETEVVRAVAGMLNSAGGRVIVGIHDSGEIKGLSRDIKLFGGDFDKFERWVLGDLLGRRIDAAVVASDVRLEWARLRGADICTLHVTKTSITSWVDDEALYVRNGNQTVQLTGRKLALFLNG